MPKVLLADDSLTIHKVVKLVLPEGFELKAVKNGDEAMSVISDFKPDVVLADIEMPSMDGYQLCEEIKKDPSTSSIPVVLLAGAYEPLDEDLAARAGADGVLVKPFESEELRDKLNEILTGGAPVSEEVLIAEEAPFEEVVLSEEGGSGEGLWENIDETPLEGVPVEEIPLEAEEEAAGFAGAPFEEKILAGYETPPVSKTPSYGAPAMPAIDPERLSAIFKESVDGKMQEFYGSVDLKALMLEAGIKESLESVLWEVVPDLSEKLIKEALAETMSTLKKELESVIWETVPELAETIIKKEMEKIRSESV